MEGQPIVFGKVVINAEQFFAPFHGVRGGRNENRRSGSIYGSHRDQWQQAHAGSGDGHLVRLKSVEQRLARGVPDGGGSWAIGIRRRSLAVRFQTRELRARRRAHIAEVARTFLAVGNGLVEVSGRNFPPPFLGVEKESPLLVFVVNPGDVNRAADGTAKIILLVRRPRRIEVVFGIEIVVADELVEVAVEGAGPGFEFRLDRAGAAASVLRPVVRGQHLELRDRVYAGKNVQAAVAAIVHVVAAVEFPVVVLDTAAIYAVLNAAHDPDLALILPGLIADAGDKSYQLREVAAVQFQLGDFLAGDGASHFRTLSFHLGHGCALDGHLDGGTADLQSHIDASFLGNIQDNAFGQVLLEALCRDRDVVQTRSRQRGD